MISLDTTVTLAAIESQLGLPGQAVERLENVLRSHQIPHSNSFLVYETLATIYYQVLGDSEPFRVAIRRMEPERVPGLLGIGIGI